MSYQVLARKWRPSVFAELVGQSHVVNAIANALDNNRLHHAYLFTGTRGVGKTTIARIFAKSLNCEQGISATPCGVCSTCEEINQGRYVDLLEIDAASRTKVEDTRELLDNVQYAPTRGRYKVYLIDEVHMLSKHSFNALLKTLEEPPEHVKFLLATTDPQKLPITILSRCLQFNLKALSREQIAGQLKHILQAEGLSFSDSALLPLARAANGSMRDALSLTDQAIAQGNGQVSQQVVQQMLGLMDKQQIIKLLNGIIEHDQTTIFTEITSLADNAADFAQALDELCGLLHQIALTQLVPEVCKLESDNPKAVFMLAKKITAEQTQLLYQMALHGKRDIHLADARMGFEMTVLRMMSFTPVNTSGDDLAAILATEAQHDTLSMPAIAEPVQTPLEQVSHPAPEIVPEPELVSEPELASQVAAEMAPQSQPHAQDAVAPEEVSTASLLAAMEALDEPAPAAEPELEQAPEREPAPETEHKPEPMLNQGLFSAEESRLDAPVSEQPMFNSNEAKLSELRESSVVPKTAFDINADIPASLPDGTDVTSAAQLDLWAYIISQLNLSGLNKQVALHARIAKQAQHVTLHLQQEQAHLVSDSVKNLLRESLTQYFQQAIELDIELGEIQGTPYQLQMRINQVRKQRALNILETDPNLVNLQKQFSTTMVAGSLQPKANEQKD